jgi:hypothetical protein
MALGALSANGAVSVTVSVGYTTTNVDGVLDDLGACVSGTVVDRDGRAVPGAGDLVRDAGVVIPIWGGARVGSSAHYGFLQQADEDGTFTICGLAPGSYALEIRGWLPAEGNLSATYPFSVTLGETRELGNVVAVNAQVYIPALSRQ